MHKSTAPSTSAMASDGGSSLLFFASYKYQGQSRAEQRPKPQAEPVIPVSTEHQQDRRHEDVVVAARRRRSRFRRRRRRRDAPGGGGDVQADRQHQQPGGPAGGPLLGARLRPVAPQEPGVRLRRQRRDRGGGGRRHQLPPRDLGGDDARREQGQVPVRRLGRARLSRQHLEAAQLQGDLD
ncbi:hypothetical protein EE612_015605, partial [Oryza sativa]